MIPDLAAFARGLVCGNPVLDQIRSRGGADPDLIVAAVLAALGHAFSGDGFSMPLQASVFEASKHEAAFGPPPSETR